MRIAIATDAWRPQVNGVVTTLKATVAELARLGHEVLLITPEGLHTLPCPTYPEIPLAVGAGGEVARRLAGFAPEAIHIVTEGPVGLATRRWCLRHQIGFTTSYHTRFPEYLRLRLPVPLSIGYAAMRWFHAPAVRTLVNTPTMEWELRQHGFRNLAHWGRGVDTVLFRPRADDHCRMGGPILLYAGRVAVEKNIEAFLQLDLPGRKIVVGDGPDRPLLRDRHPEVWFTGMLQGEALARHLAAADVFVFPSRTDTFGLVMLEAMASGVPVAAYPVAGPIDVVRHGETGWLAEDLRSAALRALEMDRNACRRYAEHFSWRRCTEEFLACLHPLNRRMAA
jgi:glycosyltransferase involved in cell wall biosynthesis